MNETTLKLNSPITEEQWDEITDVDFYRTEKIYFTTKHGKKVWFVKKRSGRWIDDKVAFHLVCSECGCTVRMDKWQVFDRTEDGYNYCPNCGAKMDLEEGEKDGRQRKED